MLEPVTSSPLQPDGKIARNSRWSSRPKSLRWPTRIFLISLGLLAFGILLHPLVDPDVYIHLRDGRHWVESGLQVGNEPFAYTAQEKPLEKAEWLFRVGIYSLWRLGGYSLVTIVKALIMTLALFFYGSLIFRRWPNLGIVGIWLGLSVLAVWTRVFPERPLVFTYCFLPLTLLLLENYRNAAAAPLKSRERTLMWIPPLVMLWANLHPGFVVLFAFIGATALDFLWDYYRTRNPLRLRQAGTMALLGAASALAGACTPQGFALYSFVLQATGNSEFMRSIVEWMPPEFHRKPVFFLLLGAVWLIQLLAWRRSRLSDFILLAVFSVMALQSRRHISLFLIAAMPAFAAHVKALAAEWFPGQTAALSLRRASLMAGSVLSLGLLIFLTTVGYAFRLGHFEDYHPAQGLVWLQTHAAQGRMFAPLHWGGYIGWMTQGKRQVFMDGRLPTFAGEIYRDYGRIIYGDPQHCLATLEKHGIEILLLSTKTYFSLFQELDKSGQWVLVYWDHVSQIYIRRSGVNQALATQWAYQALDPNATPYFNPRQPAQAMAELERAARAAPHSYLPLFFQGDLLLQSGQPGAAEKLLRQVMAMKPKHIHTLFDLAWITFQTDRLSESEKFLRQALRYQPDKDFQAKSYHLLALVARQNPARRQEALRFARYALARRPDWPAVQQLIQSLESQP